MMRPWWEGLTRSRRTRRSPSAIPVRGGPLDGQRVRHVLTTADGEWIMDRAHYCQPPDQRGQPRATYPYVLRDGVYVWNESRNEEQ
jgi:hypothetical protein